MKKKYKKAYLEIINYCNLSCSFCPKTKRKKKMLSLEEAEKAIGEIKTQTDYIYLHVMGEPLLHPELSGILKICGREGLKATVTTNGVLLSKCEEMLLKEPAVYKMQISLHSFEANDLPFSLEEYLLEICRFSKRASEETKMIVVLRLWNQDNGNLSGENQLNGAVLRLLRQEFALDSSEEEMSSFLFRGKDVELAPRVFLQSARKFGWPDSMGKELGEQVFCYGLRNQFGVLADGTVVPCCLDHEGEIPLGNLWETPLEEILKGERAKKLYDGFSRRYAEEPLCRTCAYARRFDVT